MSRHAFLFAALVLGAVLGAASRALGDAPWLLWVNVNLLGPIGQIFLRLIFMVVVPLVFCALVLGVYELGKSRGVGRIAAKTLMFTVIASSLSVIIGVSLVNLIRPGVGVRIDPAALHKQDAAAGKIAQSAKETKSLPEIIVELVPRNPIDTATRALGADMVPFMVFALIFGFALVAVGRDATGEPVLVGLLEQMLAVTMKIIDFAMYLAPPAVFALIFGAVFSAGTDILKSLAFYVLTVVAGLLIQQFLVYTAMLKMASRWSPWDFFKRCREVYLYAFSTSSSNATLPITLETARARLQLPPETSRFVLTVGSTANQNGTALFEGVTILFLAQVYGVSLSLPQQIQIVLLSIVAGIGTAGVPGGSLPLIVIILQHFGIPAEGIGLILGVDRFLDPCRTVINVSGDLVIAALVSENGASRLNPSSARIDASSRGQAPSTE